METDEKHKYIQQAGVPKWDILITEIDVKQSHDEVQQAFIGSGDEKRLRKRKIVEKDVSTGFSTHMGVSGFHLPPSVFHVAWLTYRMDVSRM